MNNAGDLIARRTLADMTEEYWDQIMDLNLKSAFLCTQAVWEEMAARKSGVIINVSSIAGRNGGGMGAAAYAAAKGGLLGLHQRAGEGTGPAGNSRQWNCPRRDRNSAITSATARLS